MCLDFRIEGKTYQHLKQFTPAYPRPQWFER